MREHLTAIRDHKKSTRRKMSKERDYYRPNNIGVKQANKMLVTFAFTRHPFNRLVSAYNCFFLHKCDYVKKRHMHNWDKHAWYRAIRNKVLWKYRHIGPLTSRDPVTPKELVQYLVGLSGWHRKQPLDFNKHIMPQFAKCPFCALKFDYIGDINDMDEHLEFLSDKLGIKVSFRASNSFKYYP